MTALRCVDDITLMSARIALADRDAVRIPYICQISGHAEELLLISRTAAEGLAVAARGAIDADEARVLAVLHMTQISESDVPDLLNMPVGKALGILEGLAARGLATAQDFAGVRCYRQNPGDVYALFQDLAAGAGNA